jgi:hypothetical protein
MHLETHHMKKAVLAAFCAITLGTGIQAAAAGGPYVGVGLGIGRIDTDAQEVANNVGVPNYTTLEPTSITYRLHGGYQITDQFAVEGFFGSLGTYTANSQLLFPFFGTVSQEVRGTALGFTGNGRVPIDADSWVFGKLGLAYWDIELTATGPGLAVRLSETGVTPVLGVGIVTGLGPGVRLRSEIEYFTSVGKEPTTIESAIFHLNVGLEVPF